MSAHLAPALPARVREHLHTRVSPRRLILRMAIAELLSQNPSGVSSQSHGDSGGQSLGPTRSAESTPSAVIINEALELARTFSSEESVKFINGMLDAIRKRVEAPKT